MNVLQTIDLKKYYGSEPNITRALDGVSLSVKQGEFVAVVGTSGSGKSTMLHMMGGLDTPTSGSVIVRGDELAEKNDEERVAIARALITKPAIILADEPTGNLDSRTSADVLGLLKRTSMEFNQTIVMITHNNEIAQLADRIVRIEDGRIVGGGRQARSAFKMPSDDLPSNASEGAQPCKGGRQARRDLGKPSDEMLPGTGKRALPRRGGGRS